MLSTHADSLIEVAWSCRYSRTAHGDPTGCQWEPCTSIYPSSWNGRDQTLIPRTTNTFPVRKPLEYNARDATYFLCDSWSLTLWEFTHVIIFTIIHSLKWRAQLITVPPESPTCRTKIISGVLAWNYWQLSKGLLCLNCRPKYYHDNSSVKSYVMDK